MNQNSSGNTMQLSSPAFKNGEAIPIQYTCKGQNVSPPLNILNISAGSMSLAIIMHDPDAVGDDFVHWLVWNIPAITDKIPTNSVPQGAIQGQNDFSKNKYGGPCPPAGSGTHHYMFELYALDTLLSLDPHTNRESLQSALKNRVLEQCNLTGLVTAG